MRVNSWHNVSVTLTLTAAAVPMGFFFGCTDERGPTTGWGGSEMESGYQGKVADWEAFLSCWEREAMGALAQKEHLLFFEKIAISRGGMGYPPASDIEITSTEGRLGVALPKSYRDFLKASNGWLRSESRFSSVSEIGWVPEKEPFLLELHPPQLAPAPEKEVPDEEYFIYWMQAAWPAGQDRFRTAYFPDLLSIAEEDGGSYYLLNPKVVFEDGEWEAWMYHPRGGVGVERYRSFAEMMRNEYFGEVKDPGYGGFYTEEQLAGTCAELLPAPLPAPPGR